jgi:hypothetical protein
MSNTARKVKRTAAKKKAVERESPFADDGRVYYTTSRGVEVECLGIIDAIQEQENNIRAQIDWPVAPTYKFSDDEIERPHTEESIKDPKTTDEERQAWNEYKAALAVANADFNARIAEARMRLLATRGVRIVDYERREKQWIEEHEWLGMKVPEDARERLVHFFKFEVVGESLDDVIGITKGIYIASGADPEVVAAGEESFRASLGRSERADAGAGAQEAAEG